MGIARLFGAVALLAVSATAYRTRQVGNQTNQTLPIVDLGYEIYRASTFNVRQTQNYFSS